MTPAQRKETLEFIFNGAAVRRYHTVPVLVPQTDGAHSFGVAMLVWLLTEGRASRELILAALTHDLGEFVTGDVPSHVKRVGTIGSQLAGLETVARAAAGVEFSAELSEDEARQLNLADNLEGLMYCVQERRLGNRNAETWFLRFHNYVIQQIIVEKDAVALEITHQIENYWMEACA